VDAGSSAARPSFTVVEGDIYTDWESVYRDNVVGIYQLVSGGSATLPTPRTWPPRC